MQFFTFEREQKPGTEWVCDGPYDTEDEAARLAEQCVTELDFDVAVVMAVGGVDALPTFTLKQSFDRRKV